ncbi:MAG: pentapeptide repeat-containing protein [Symploca sp. SIO2B6]|nr:pentapeptide repeat-containing protein [Symploca sp. SIO2B6]
MMRSLRYIGAILAIIMVLVMGIGVSPSHAGSSTAIRAKDGILDDYSGQTILDLEFYNEQKALIGKNFSNANIEGAVMKGSNLQGANLSGANLNNSFLFQTNLSKADLTNAIFTEAMLLQTTFDGATITGADFSYAVITDKNLKVLCEVAEGTNSVTGADTRESLGCR